MSGTSSLDRRNFLRAAGGTGVALAASGVLLPHAGAESAAFVHGVASGDPLPDGVVLWTRVTPTPESTPGSGAGPRVDVRWEMSRDASFATIVRDGEATAGPDTDHTVKVEADGLEPDTWYHYRFRFGSATSPAGRTRTAPAADAEVAGLRLGLASCSNYAAGHFAAYRHAAERGDLDLFVHVGDYLYEGGGAGVRAHRPAKEITTLADYRQRHAQYKTDPDLQALHAAVPWIPTWDDHEVVNDYWENGSGDHDPATEGDFAARKAAGHRAYFEWMPVRRGPDGGIHRRYRWGRLADLTMLDLRGHRSRQGTPEDFDDPSRTFTGRAQMAWLKDGLSDSTAQWHLIGNSVMVTPVSLQGLVKEVVEPLGELIGGGLLEQVGPNADAWEGYRADRDDLLTHLRDNGITDTVFLTGDVHVSWATEVTVDRTTYPWEPPVATELVCTSVTSANLDDLLDVPPRTISRGAEGVLHLNNPYARFCELDSHGFVLIDVTPRRMQADWYFVSDPTDPDATLTHGASFASRAGTQRLHRAFTPVT
ncbi:alkaline phosphatase [Actinomadura sp. WMMB 499]|uniref:alkaline phosphatase D family protein n=1 Tax=Actinomadura sp. WMMB 499 TaxID=1219491 RepID=UPI001246F0EA|nr:alkaline phosphatase D family protein [Actinomadura sp. WMMB 499]QFG22811.1 alkaline phosphatase [Actinomadura sp. WMMB 499]